MGRLGSSPENGLAHDYAARATLVGRSLALGPVEIAEIDARQKGKAAESEALLAKVADAWLVACDEHGRSLPSADLAKRLADLRDRGERHVAFAVGGADGHDPKVLTAARETLAFGVQTWPHALVRVMLAEQIYRALGILAGSPYHRA